MIEPVLGAVADKVVKHAGQGLLDGVKKSSNDLFYMVLGDQVSEWRTRNILRIAEKTAQRFHERGIDISAAKSLPNSELYAIFDGASRTDEPSLQELWAGLMTTAMDPTTDLSARAALTTALSQMDALDAQLFQAIVEALAALSRFDTQARQRHVEHERLFPITPETRDSPKAMKFNSETSEKRKEFIEGFAKMAEKKLSPSVQGFEDSKSNLGRIGLISTLVPAIPSPPQTAISGPGRGYDSAAQITRAIAIQGQYQAEVSKRLSEPRDQLPDGPLVSAEEFQGITFHVRLTSLGRRLAAACELGDQSF